MPDSNSATSLLFFWLAVIELPRFILVDILLARLVTAAATAIESEMGRK